MAKTTEISIGEKLRQLFALQKIDTKIDEIEILKGELLIEVSDLEDEITGLETRLKNLNETVKDIEKAVASPLAGAAPSAGVPLASTGAGAGAGAAGAAFIGAFGTNC